MANIKLSVDSNYYLQAEFDESIQAGEDITIAWSFDSSIEYYRIGLVYQNNKRKRKDYITGQYSKVIKAPFNELGFLGLQFEFDSAEGGRKKTNTIWANIHYSIIDGDAPEDVLAQLQALAFTSTEYSSETGDIVFYNVSGQEVARVPVTGVDVRDILERLSELETEMLQARADIEMNTQSVEQNMLAVQNHEARINDNAALIKTSQDDLVALNSSLASVNSELESHDSRIKINFDNTAANSILISENSTAIQTNTTNVATNTADIAVLQSDLTSNVSSLQTAIDNIVRDVYTKEEIDNKLSGLVFDTSWQEPVATYADLATTYPIPEVGWIVLVLDEGNVYNYNGTEWVRISNGAVTEYAGETTDGIITSANFRDWQAKATAEQVQGVQSNVDTLSQRVQANETSITDINTKISAQELNEQQDLNDLHGAAYWARTYYAVGGNTVANKPANVDTFHLAVMRSSDIYTSQLLCSTNTNIGWFVRVWNGTAWSEWTNDTADIDSELEAINAQIEANTQRIEDIEAFSIPAQLTSESLDNIQGEQHWNKTYYGTNDNTVLNKPFNVTGFFLVCLRSSGTATTQALYSINNAALGWFARTYDSSDSAWTEWSNDIPMLQEQIDNIKGTITVFANSKLLNADSNVVYIEQVNLASNGVPAGFWDRGMLITFGLEADRGTQLLFTDTGLNYKRNRVNSDIGEWTRTDNIDIVTQFNQLAGHATSDLDTMLNLTDSYNVKTNTYAGTATGAPANAYGYVDTVYTAPDIVTQWAHDYNGSIFYRSRNNTVTTQWQSIGGGSGGGEDKIMYIYPDSNVAVATIFSLSITDRLIWSNYPPKILYKGVITSYTRSVAANASHTANCFLFFNLNAFLNSEATANWLRFARVFPGDDWYIVGHTFVPPVVTGARTTQRRNVYIYGTGWIRDTVYNVRYEANKGTITYLSEPDIFTADTNGNLTIKGSSSTSLRMLVDKTEYLFSYTNPIQKVISYSNNALLYWTNDTAVRFSKYQLSSSNTNAIPESSIAIGMMMDKVINGAVVPGVYIYGLGWIDPNTEAAALKTRIDDLESRLAALETT